MHNHTIILFNFCLLYLYIYLLFVFSRRLGLDVRDFGPSWRSGVAFHAVIFALRPRLVDMERVWNQPNRANLEEAFSLAERELGIPRLLDPEGKHNPALLLEYYYCISYGLNCTVT